MPFTKKKSKIYRKYSDFYSAKDLFESHSPEINLTIEDFDSNGHIVNPKAPCVVTSVDPEYIRDAGRRPKVRKFLVKSDILKLRDLMRTKFFYYRCQQSVYENAKKQQYQTKLYEDMKDFYKLCYDRLAQCEHEAFSQMQAVYKELKGLQGNKLQEELEIVELENQKILMEVKEIYRRFRYLLKLINYFDHVSEESDRITTLTEILNKDFDDFLNTMPENHSMEDIEKFRKVLEETVMPYLEKKNYLNVELWQAGFRSMQRKMFNYNKHLSHVAILNHIVQIVHDKFMKSYNLRIEKRIFLKSVEFLKCRGADLKNNTIQMFNKWETMKKNDLINIEIESVVPTMLNQLTLNDQNGYIFQDTRPDENITTTLEKVTTIQNRLMALLNKLDYIEPEFLRRTERQVVKQLAIEKKASKLALVQQTRIVNLIDHYKRHHKQKNISDGYITLLPRNRHKLFDLKNKLRKTKVSNSK